MTLYLRDWGEMNPWPSIWELDFGFAPIGAHKIEPDMLWYFNSRCMDGGEWNQTEMHMLYASQIAAALSRLLRIEGLTVQIRGETVWIHRNIYTTVRPQGNGCQLFEVESLLIMNLANAVKFVMNANWIKPVAIDGTSNLQMLLGKFDIE